MIPQHYWLIYFTTNTDKYINNMYYYNVTHFTHEIRYRDNVVDNYGEKNT